MHTLGKVLLWLNVVGALGAIVLTAKLLDVRNSWVKEIEQKQKQVEQNAGQLADLREEHRRLRSDLGDTLIGWDRAWDIPAGNVGFNQQGIQVQGLGVNQGFVTPGADPTNPMPGQLPIVHVFQVTPAGTHFAGTFQATQVGADGSSLEPMWHVEPADFAHLEQQGVTAWRFRMEVPASRTSEFARLRTLRSSAMRDLENQQFYLQDSTEQEMTAGQLLTARREQLEGNGVSPGLVANLTAAGDARDAEAVQLDALRRQVKSRQDRIAALEAEVKQLEAQLQPPAQTPTQPPTQPQPNTP